MAKIEIEVDEAELLEQVQGRVAEWTRDRFEGQARDLINVEVREATRAQIHARVEAQLTAIFAEGWEKTDEYGRPKGQRLTLRDFALEVLTSRDRYSSNGSWLDNQVKALLEKALREAVGPEIAEAKNRLRAMLDEEIQGRLTKAVREAFGLKG